MSTEHLFWVGTCPATGKRQYDQRQYDQRRIARTIAKRHHPGKHMQVFRCRACGYWHVGAALPGGRRLSQEALA